MKTNWLSALLIFLISHAAAEEITATDRVEYPIAKHFVEGGRFATALALDGKGGFWVGSEDKGLHYCDGLFWYEIETPYRYEHAVSAAANGESCWLGLSRSGAAEVKSGGAWRFHDILSGLGAHRINDLAWDKSGALWAATDRGVWRYDGDSWSFAGAPPGDEVTCVVQWQDRVLAGTGLSGIWTVSEAGLEPLRATGLPDRRVCDLAVGPADSLWAGTFSGPAFLDEDQWIALKLPLEPRTKEQEEAALAPQSHAVLCLVWDGKDGILMGTRTEGILHYYPKAKQWRRATPRLGHWANYVNKLILDANGSLWAATHGAGVLRFEKEGMAFWDGKTALRLGEGKVHSSGGWTYDDRSTAVSLGQFLMGRVLRMAQVDAQERSISLYFNGLAGMETAAAASDVPSAYQGVVLLDYSSGKVVWSHPAIPYQPVRWSQAASRVAYRTSKEQVVIDDWLEKTDRTCDLPIDAKRFFFLDGGTLVFDDCGGKRARLVLTEHSGSWTGSSGEPVPDDPSPIRRFQRAIVKPAGPDEKPPPTVGTAGRPGDAEWDAGTAILGLQAVELGPAGSRELPGGQSHTCRLQETPNRPLVFFSFDYEDLQEPAEGLASFEIVVESGKRTRTHEIDEVSPVPRRIVIGIPVRARETPKLCIRAPRGRRLKLTDMKWLTANIRGARALPMRFRIRSGEPSGPVLAPSNPAIHVKSPDGSGLTVQRLPYGQHELDFLFDGSIGRAGWKAPEGMLGWTLEIAFAEEVRVDGVVAFGTAGPLSQQMEGICIEAWEPDAALPLGGKWKWHRGLVAGRQFHQGIFHPCTTTKIRVTGLSREAKVSELMVFAREPEE